MELYPWVVTAHVVFVILAFGAHGVSAFSMFRLRRETDRARIGALVDLSATSLWGAGIGLIVAVVLGIVAAVMGGFFGSWWPWVSIVLVVVVWIMMTPMAAGPMNEIRKALGQSVRGDKKDDPPRQPASDADLAAAQARLRPELVGAIGIAAIVILTWLMEAKPL
jgi:hypothetical protein